MRSKHEPREVSTNIARRKSLDVELGANEKAVVELAWERERASMTGNPSVAANSDEDLGLLTLVEPTEYTALASNLSNKSKNCCLGRR